MGEPAKKRATYEDLLAVPENMIAEIIDGELVTQPRPAGAHTRAATKLGGALDGPFDNGENGPGGWYFMVEPELHLHGDILVPDLAGWRKERMPSNLAAAAFELAPAWLCEVLSPSTAKRDRHAKLPIYAREGVQHVWLIDPLMRLLEVYRLEGDHWRWVGAWDESSPVRAEPFGAVALDLGRLWLPQIVSE